MSLTKSLFACNLNKITHASVRHCPSFVSLSLRFSSSQTLSIQQIPEISKDDRDLLKVIDEYDTIESESQYDRAMKLSSHRSRRFAAKRQRKLREILNDTQKYHPVIYSLLSAKTGAEIMDLLKDINVSQYSHEEICEENLEDVDGKNSNPTIHRIYSKAIRCAADLGAFDVASTIFEECKTKQIISNELYNTMMWCSIYKSRSDKSLDEVFALYEELNQVMIDHNLSVHPRTYSTLINSCIKLNKLQSALKVLHNLKMQHPQVLNHCRVRQAAIQLLLRTLDIDEAIQLLHSTTESEEKVWADFDVYRINDILYALASHKNNSHAYDFVEKAEKLFKKSLSVAIKHQVSIPAQLFNAMIAVYAKANDYDSCYVLLQYMMDTKQKHKLFPSPTQKTFEHILFALMQHQDNDEKWRKVHQIIQIREAIAIDSSNIRKSLIFHSRLMDLCATNINKAKEFYSNMIEKEDIKPDMKMLSNLFIVGMNQYKNNTTELQAFVRYIIEQHKKYNITPTQEIKAQWKIALTA